jgi:hypothetical protein
MLLLKRVILGLGITVLVAWEGQAQSPLGPEFGVNTESGVEIEADIKAGPDGVFTVAWLDYVDVNTGPEYIAVRRFASSGGERRELRLLEFSVNESVSGQRLAPTQGGFTVFYSQSRPNGDRRIYGSRFTNGGFAVGSRFVVSKPPPSASDVVAAAALPKGGYFVLAEDDLCFTCQDQRHHLFARILDKKGGHSSPYLQVDLDDRRAGFTGATSLSVDSEGNCVAVWEGASVKDPFDPAQTAILGQRFLPAGQRLGEPFLVNDPATGHQILPSVAAGASGDFSVVWQYQPDESTPKGIRGKRFWKNGKQLGQEFVVAADEVADSVRPAVAADAAGNFVVVWTDIELPFCPFVKGRLFRKNGRPVGPSFYLTASTDNCDELPQVSFGPQGVLAATWRRDLESGDFDVYAARFLASPGDEPCLVRGGQVLCFTPTSGGEPVLTQAFGGRPGETTLIGDFDGDGRADLCTRFGTTFACDLRHYGALSDGTAVSFGLDSDIPLLGDIDGDGKADLCVYRGGQFLCDTTRQGGVPNVTISFGLPTDIPLLGDIDGDGKADPCVYRAGIFLCDTTHQGAAPNVSIPFGQPGDQPALGDIDGDGKADPCVLHAGHLLCDTTHHGGKPNVDINLHAKPGDRLIIGNLDGL